MSGDTDNPPSSSGPTNASLTHLPWAMIPNFRPGETDINEYTKKLEFLASLWPVEHLSHLAPRAAMLCEGSSFKRVMRLDAAKLKVNSTAGVQLLVSTLGGIWGKRNLEEKFERFERAIYTTVQRSDESHDSYMARHDYQFEELLQMGVKLEDTRAYIFVDSQGNLEYKNIVSSLKLLGSKFFMNCSPVASTPAESRHMMSMLFSMMKPGSHRQKKTKLLLGRPGKNGIFSMTTMIPMQSFACNSKRACVKPCSVTLNLQHVTIRILMLGVESPTRTRAVDFGVPPRVSTIPRARVSSRARVRADSGSRLPSASWNLNAGAAVPKGTGKLSVL